MEFDKDAKFKTKVSRKVTIGEETVTLEILGREGAIFTPIVYHVIRNHRGFYDVVEGEFKTKKEAVSFFKELTEKFRPLWEYEASKIKTIDAHTVTDCLPVELPSQGNSPCLRG